MCSIKIVSFLVFDQINLRNFCNFFWGKCSLLSCFVYSVLKDNSATHVARLDKNGNRKSSKLIGSSIPGVYGTAEMPWSVSQTADKGFLVSAWLPEASNPRPYSIIRLDSTICDTTNEYCRQALEVGLVDDAMEMSKYSLFPNPANDFLYITDISAAGSSAEVAIYSLTGDLLKTHKIDQESQAIDLENLPPGMYVAVIMQDEKVLGREKFVVCK